jgi:hypothetical protein
MANEWADFDTSSFNPIWRKNLEGQEQAAYYSAAPFGAGYSRADRTPLVSQDNPWGGMEFNQAGDPMSVYGDVDPQTGAPIVSAQGGYTPAQQQYWSGQYGNVLNQYKGELGRRMRQGNPPGLSFTEFLENYPWTERYTALPPSLTPGVTPTRFAPSVRYMY